MIIVLLGVVDDKYDLNAKFKFLIQILAAVIPVSQGCVIRYISNPLPIADYPYLPLRFLAIPCTIIWIVALTNAVNFIDGLDGLSVGIWLHQLSGHGRHCHGPGSERGSVDPGDPAGGLSGLFALQPEPGKDLYGQTPEPPFWALCWGACPSRGCLRSIR